MNDYLIWVTACLVGATALTRFAPFLFLGSLATDPRLGYLGRNLPVMVMPILVVYAMSPTKFVDFGFAGSQILAVLITVLLHVWKRNVFLSIFGGTAAYLLFKHLI
jgi:branched-subunit amino acid transport protein AzlD